jgi:DNA-binding SARP family transcriptional activator/predicted ATPase
MTGTPEMSDRTPQPPLPVRIGLLGPVELRVARQPRPVGGRRPQTVLVALALNPERTIGVDRLVEAAWTDPPPSAEASLAAVISRLRKVLAPATIDRVGRAYVLRLPPEAVDATRFERDGDGALEAMRRGDPGRALDLADRALGMWRGQPLEGMAPRPPVVATRRRLRARRLDLQIVRGEALLELGRVREAVDALRRAVERHPEREHAWSVLATALYRGGQQQEALAVLREAAGALRDTTGLEPSPALVDLEQAILHHAPDLSGTPSRSPGTTAAATTFHGRMAELEVVTRSLARRQHVTIVGPPGVGKTRLAAEALTRARDHRPVRWVDVRAHAESPEQLMSAVLTALDVPAVAEAPPPDALAGWIAGRSLILVLDAAEHLPDEVVLLCQLLGAGSGVTAIVTSQQRMDLPRAATVDLDPLTITAADGGPGPAVRLYRDRAAALALAPGAAVPDVTTATRLCELLDGLPLGIEVAAGLLRTFDPPSLVRHLEQDRSLLLRDLVGPEARLGLALQDSWDRLAPPARHVLAASASFAGTFTMPMLTAVVAPRHPQTSVAAGLQGLVSSSLVQVQSDDRDGLRTYRVLDTVRALATGRQEPDEEHACAAAHAAWVAAEAAEIEKGVHGPDQTRHLDRMTDLLADADQAVRWALLHDPALAMDVAGRLAWPMFLRTRLTTLRSWIDRIDAEVGEDRMTPAAWLAASIVRYAQQRIPEAAACAERALAHGADPELREFLRFWLAWVRSLTGAPDSPEAMADCARRAADLGLASVTSYAGTGRAWVQVLAGDPAAAADLAEANRPAARDSGQAWAVAFNSFVHGVAAEQAGRLHDTAAAQLEALELSMRTGHMTGIAEHLASLATVGAHHGRTRDASRVLGALEVFVPATGMNPDLLVAFRTLTEVLDDDVDEPARADGRGLQLSDLVDLARQLARPSV